MMPVTGKEGQKMAKLLRANKYIECSITRKQGLKELFEEAILAGFRYRQKQGKGKEYGNGEGSNSICSIQ
jgi:hypothetical protein